MKKIIFLVLCVLAVIVSVQGQTAGHYDFSTPQAPFSSSFFPRGSATTSDGGTLVWGMSGGFPPQMGVFKLSSNKQVIWTRTLSGIQDVTGELVEMSNVYVLATYQSSPAYGRVVQIDKTTGVVVRQHEYTGRIRGIDKSTDSTVLISGEIQTPSFYIPGFNQFPWDGWVCEVNLQGDTLWTERIGTLNRADALIDVVDLPGSGRGYFAAGTLVPDVVSPLPPTNNNDMFVVGTNSSGDIIVAKQFDFLPAHSGSGFASETPYKCVLVDTVLYSACYLNGTSPNRGAVVAVSKSGNWVKTLVFGYKTLSHHTAAFGITPGVGGGILVSGMSKYKGFTLKLNDTLGFEWARKMPNTIFAWQPEQNTLGDGYNLAARTISPHGFSLTDIHETGYAGGPTCSDDTLNFTVFWYDTAIVSTPNLLQGVYPYKGVQVSALTGATTLVLQDSCLSVSTLPVELLDFSAKVEGEKVLLEWVTASEQDNDYFEVLRGRDPWSINEVVGRVDGAGTSQETVRYEIYDNEPMIGTSYYQLRQVDYDFAGTHSKVVSVTFERDRVVWPNPTRDLVYGLPRSVNVSVYDMTGRLVKRFVRSDGSINLSELVTGTYLLQMDDGRKHIIQKE